MMVWHVPFSVELSGPVVGRSRSLSWVVALRFPVRSATFPVKHCHPSKAAVLLRASWFSRSARQNHRKNTIQSP